MLKKRKRKNSAVSEHARVKNGRSSMSKKKGWRLNLHRICGMDKLVRYNCCTKREEIFTWSMVGAPCVDHSLSILFFGFSRCCCSMADVGEAIPRHREYMQACLCKRSTCRSPTGLLVKTSKMLLLAVLVLSV
jgi:hypothetical protein